MYLKCLEIQGFKSFADKTILQFNTGLTSVVGPNGSGKSNIADAVRWVLGEQSAKTLRGGKMEDVIFAGTQQRKPVGFASVSLTIDNNDKMLPIEFSEVTVGRRMYRSGESEYFINKTACRLKDIQELFMNTGVGREGYSIIGQGRIDEILSTKSDERRLVFEEAAGITKYKMRKREAEKKLEGTRQNLLRIKDIINELESQLGPLSQQAETAKKYLSLSNELKEIEVSLFLDTIDKLKVRIEEVSSQSSAIKEQVEEENQKLEAIKVKNRVRNERLERLKRECDQLREAIHALDTDLEKNDSQHRLLEEKIKHLTASNDGFGDDIVSIRERMTAVEADVEKKKKRLTQLERDAEHFAALLKEAEEKLAAIVARLDEGEKMVEEAKQAIMDKQDALSDTKIRVNNLKNDQEHFKQLQQNLSNELRQLSLEKDRENMQKEDLDTSLRKTRESLQKSKNTSHELEAQKNGKQKALVEVKGRQDAARRELHTLESKHKVLVDMEESMEGYSHSVKAVMQASYERADFGKGIHGALGQLVTVTSRFETAVEVCLGGALQNIVTEDEFTAKRAIEFLKNNRLGRSTFLPISSVKPRTLEPHILNGVKSMNGFECIGSDAIQTDSHFSGIILNLLGRTVIVDNMDSGIAMARRYDYAFRIVTIDGELINAGGSMTGGSLPSKSSSLIGRQRVIKELEQEIVSTQDKLRRIDGEQVRVEEEIASLSKAFEEEKKTLSDLELIRLRDESHLMRISDNLKKLAARSELIRQQHQEIDAQMAKIEQESLTENEKVRAVEEQIKGLKEQVLSHQINNKDEQAKRDELHTDINDYKVSVNSIIESRESMTEQIARLLEEKQTFAESLDKRESDKQRNIQRIAEYKAEMEGLKSKGTRIGEEKTGKQLQAEGLQEEIGVLEEELSGLLDTVTGHNQAVLALQEEQGRLEARRVKTETELETIQNRLWDEYGLTFGNAQEFKIEITNFKLTQSRINELKAEIRELGPVNVAAIEDFTKTKERFQFMKKQHDDLVQAEEKLMRVIQDVTQVMRKQFVEQFALINKHFGIVFKEIFEGGHAEVTLTDTENVLESGIDISVQPPGKKLQNMMLLSGGEKALVAIALIFAILKMRPAPFYLLDEIEAALDDANVYKFADYLKNYTNSVQFIIITHRKGTMEAADTLYGVTMQEYGISKVVSMQLDHVIEKEHAG